MASDKNYGITVHQEKTGTRTQLVHSVVMVLEPRMVRTNLLSVLDGFSPIEDGYEMVARAWLDGVVVACFTKKFKAAPVVKVRISKPYGGETLHLRIGGSSIGTVTESTLEPGLWLCDVRWEHGYVTVPKHEGSLLSALRYIKRQSTNSATTCIGDDW